MDKKIEGLAREYAAKLNYSMEAKHNMCPRDFEIAFCDGANYVFNLPLASRLTAEEKERVRKEYANTYPNDIDCGVENILIQGVLERIFGADFFKEEE